MNAQSNGNGCFHQHSLLYYHHPNPKCIRKWCAQFISVLNWIYWGVFTWIRSISPASNRLQNITANRIVFKIKIDSDRRILKRQIWSNHSTLQHSPFYIQIHTLTHLNNADELLSSDKTSILRWPFFHISQIKTTATTMKWKRGKW